MGGWEKWHEMTLIECDKRMPAGLKVAVYKISRTVKLGTET